jgi:hypothetical protein
LSLAAAWLAGRNASSLLRRELERLGGLGRHGTLKTACLAPIQLTSVGTMADTIRLGGVIGRVVTVLAPHHQSPSELASACGRAQPIVRCVAMQTAEGRRVGNPAWARDEDKTSDATQGQVCHRFRVFQRRSQAGPRMKRDRLITASKRRRHLGSRQRRLEEEMTSAALPWEARQRRTGAVLSDSPIVVIPKHRHADTMCQRTQTSHLVRRHGIWARVG